MNPVVLYEVAPGRCPCCGGSEATWTAGRIIAALQAWARKHGRAPSKRDWLRSAVDHPAYETVYEVFGSIKAARHQAGLAETVYRPATHCKHGHKFTVANTYLYRGKRLCRACRSWEQRRWRKDQAAA